jgi:hypothetical protein
VTIGIHFGPNHLRNVTDYPFRAVERGAGRTGMIAAMSRKVYVHIGAPKTGTTYLQDRLARNARSLAQHDVHLPSGSSFVSPGMFHFRAALDLLDQDWGGPPGHAAGSWDALVKRIGRLSGTVIFSHEILAPAAPQHIARLMSDLADSEVHVVYSARDLARQVPAGWQESVKQGRRWSYRRYLRRVTSDQPPWFARAFDLPAVLGQWSGGLTPDRVHVVTVPSAEAARADPGLLWSRFCTVFGIDPAWAPEDSGRVNTSLGMAETQVLRGLNRRIDRTTRRESDHDQLIRGLLAEETLAARRRSRPITLPPKLEDWAAERGRAWVEWIEGSGVDVVGDLEDLRPGEPPVYRNPDKVPTKLQLKAALDALAAMTAEAAARPDPDGTLRARVRRARELRGR